MFYSEEQIKEMKTKKNDLVAQAITLQRGKCAPGSSEYYNLCKVMGKIISINRKLGTY